MSTTPHSTGTNGREEVTGVARIRRSIESKRHAGSKKRIAASWDRCEVFEQQRVMLAENVDEERHHGSDESRRQPHASEAEGGVLHQNPAQ